VKCVKNGTNYDVEPIMGYPWTSVWMTLRGQRSRHVSIWITGVLVSKLFHRLIAAHEYFPTYVHCRGFTGWNNFISVSDVVTCDI